MCLIIVKSSGVDLPDDSVIRKAESSNDDGIGIAWYKPGDNIVRIKKDFKDSIEFISWSKDNLKKEDKVMIHFRWRTHGLNDIGNRHPFPITRNITMLRSPELVCRFSVAHNGVFSGYEHNKFSDTQKFIMDILASNKVKLHLTNPAIQKLINNHISGSRVSTLDYKGNLILFGKFEEENGLYFSNNYWKHTSPASYEYGQIGWQRGWDDDEYDEAITKKEISNPYHCEICNKRNSTGTIMMLGTVLDICKKCNDKIEAGKVKPCASCEEFFHVNNMQVIRDLDNEWVCDRCAKDFLM